MLYLIGIPIALFILYLCYTLVKQFIISRKNVTYKSNTANTARSLLINDLKRAKKSIKILSGYIETKIYSDEIVRQNLENALVRGIEISVVVGAIDKGNKNHLIKLSKFYPNLNIVELNSERVDPHFRIIDNRDIYLEKYHIKNSFKRNFSYFNDNRILISAMLRDLDKRLKEKGLF